MKKHKEFLSIPCVFASKISLVDILFLKYVLRSEKRLKKVMKLADLCWEGLTLQHITHKEIIIPYMWFTFTAILFEIFLAILICVSSFFFIIYNSRPNLEYYIAAAIVFFLLILHIATCVTILKKRKGRKISLFRKEDL